MPKKGTDEGAKMLAAIRLHTDSSSATVRQCLLGVEFLASFFVHNGESPSRLETYFAGPPLNRLIAHVPCDLFASCFYLDRAKLTPTFDP